MRQAIFVWLMASSVCLAEPVSLRRAGGAAGHARPVLQHLVTGRSADRLRHDALDRPAASLARHGARGWPAVSRHGAAAGRRGRLAADRRDGLADANRLSVRQRASETHADVPDAGVAVGPGRAGPAGDLHHVGRPVRGRPAARGAARIQPGRRTGGQHGGPAGDLGSADRWRASRCSGSAREPSASWARKGDDLRIEWGYAYLAAPADQTAGSHRRRTRSGSTWARSASSRCNAARAAGLRRSLLDQVFWHAAASLLAARRRGGGRPAAGGRTRLRGAGRTVPGV